MEELITYLIWVTLAIAVFLICFKIAAIKNLRNKHNLVLRLKLLDFYSQQTIYTTTSLRKKDCMVTSNRLTVLIYLCLMPVSISLMVNVLTGIKLISDHLMAAN